VARALAAVNVKDFARHEAGRLEVEDRADDVGDLAHMAQRVQGAQLRMRLNGMHRRLDDAQGDGVHPDTALRILDRERFGRAVQTALRQRRKHGRYAGDRVVDQARRDLHDMAAALLLHLGDGELRNMKEAGDVDAQDRCVVGPGVLGEGLGDEDASVVGERYAAACRRVLTDLEEADISAGGERAAPRGTLTLTAPVVSGEVVLRPILDAFMEAYPAVSARLYLLDRPVNLIDEGIDIALRIGHLPDSTLVAIRVGEVRLVVAATPRYLAQHPRIDEPGNLAKHQIIAFTQRGLDSWSFSPLPGSPVPQTVHFTPQLVINTVGGAVASAVDGHGVTRVLSYQVAEHVRAGELEIVLQGDEPPPLPVHVISPHGRLSVPKVRAFVDFAVPRLRSHFARMAKDIGDRGTATRSQRGRVSAE